MHVSQNCPYISKTAGRGVKLTEILDSNNIWDTFNLVMFKAIRKAFGSLVSKWPVTRKRLVIECNGVKFTAHFQVVPHISNLLIEMKEHCVCLKCFFGQS